MTAMLDRFQIEDLLREAWRRSPRSFGRALAEYGVVPPRRVHRTRVAPKIGRPIGNVTIEVMAMIRARGHAGAKYVELADAMGRNLGAVLGRLAECGQVTRSARGRYMVRS
jgi:hypothetical protein